PKSITLPERRQNSSCERVSEEDNRAEPFLDSYVSASDNSSSSSSSSSGNNTANSQFPPLPELRLNPARVFFLQFAFSAERSKLGLPGEGEICVAPPRMEMTFVTENNAAFVAHWEQGLLTRHLPC